MRTPRQAAFVAAFALSACGGGGGGDTPAPPAAIAPADALRLAAQAVMDVAELAWALSFDLQNTVVSAPGETVRDVACAQGGRTVVSRPAAGLLRIEQQGCQLAGITADGRVEAEDAVVSADADGTSWVGTVRWAAYSVADGSRAQRVSATVTGSGFVENVAGTRTRGQPMSMQFSALSATRTPDALSRGATLASAALRVDRQPANLALARDLYALNGCVGITAPGVAAELCLDAGSQIALLENVGSEQLSGRLRWNAGTPGGFDARLRATPGGAPGTSTLRIELDLDGNGSLESSATLDRTTDIGLRL